jgi:hypothetical protein
MMMCEYRVLNYSPTATSESEEICIVIINELCLNGVSELRIYCPSDWREKIPPNHLDYIAALAADWQGAPPRDAGLILSSLQNLSTGPLRLSDVGTCGEADLQKLLISVFQRSGYTAL